jgi:hypothetical protein
MTILSLNMMFCLNKIYIKTVQVEETVKTLYSWAKQTNKPIKNNFLWAKYYQTQT